MAKSEKPKKTGKVISFAEEKMKAAQKNSPKSKMKSSQSMKPGAK